jgi:hypothetical protein
MWAFSWMANRQAVVPLWLFVFNLAGGLLVSGGMFFGNLHHRSLVWAVIGGVLFATEIVIMVAGTIIKVHRGMGIPASSDG